jgi:hypothetical protein
VRRCTKCGLEEPAGPDDRVGDRYKHG